MENVEIPLLSTEEQANEKQLLEEVDEPKALITEIRQKANTTEMDHSPDIMPDVVTETDTVVSDDIKQLEDTSMPPLESFAMISHQDGAQHSVDEQESTSEPKDADDEQSVTPRSTMGIHPTDADGEQFETPKSSMDYQTTSEATIETEDKCPCSDATESTERESAVPATTQDQEVHENIAQQQEPPVDIDDEDEPSRTCSSFDIIDDAEVEDMTIDISPPSPNEGPSVKSVSDILTDPKQLDDLFKYKQAQLASDDMCKWSTASTCSNDTIMQQKLFNESALTAEIVDDKSEKDTAEDADELIDNGIEEEEDIGEEVEQLLPVVDNEKVNENESVPIIESQNVNEVQSTPAPVETHLYEQLEPEKVEESSSDERLKEIVTEPKNEDDVKQEGTIETKQGEAPNEEGEQEKTIQPKQEEALKEKEAKLEETPKAELPREEAPKEGKAEEKEEEKAEEKEEEKAASQKDDWIQVLGNDALKKRITKHGQGENLEKGQQVRMKYTLMLSNGKIVDDNVEQTFQLGDGEVIDAIDLTANLAKVGEVYEAMSQSRFGYGILGQPPHVGSNCSLLIVIEILQAEDTPKICDMTESERISIGDRKRKIGNDHFARHDFERASKNYQCACKYLDPPSYQITGVPSAEIKELQAKSWCNLALTELKLGKFANGIQAANRALEIDPESTKALYRKGKLLEQNGELEEAEKALKLAVKLEPGSQGCVQFLKELTKKIASQKRKQQQMYKKMFSLEDEEKKKTSFGEKETTWLEGAIPMVAGAVTIGALAVAAYSGFRAFQG